MSPTEVEEYIVQREPFQPVRLTLASGDQVIVHEGDRPFVSGLALVLRGIPEGSRIVTGSRLVSIPNIVLAETIERRPGAGGRRPR